MLQAVNRHEVEDCSQLAKRAEAGYTLVETLVAMSIFLSVVIPIGAAVGNMVLQNDSSLMQQALHHAQSEVTKTSNDAQSDESEKVIDRFMIRKSVVRNSDLIDVIVTVNHSSKPEKSLVKLHKTFLVER